MIIISSHKQSVNRKQITLTLILLLCLFTYPFFLSAQYQYEIFENEKDSLATMLEDARKYSNKGDFVKGDEYIQVTLNYYNKIREIYKNSGFSFGNLEFEILNAQAWNKTLLKKYALAETLYKNLIENTPDTLHLNLSNAYTGISSLYGMQKQYKLSEEYALKALNEAKLANSSDAAFHAQSNLGDIYMETGEYEKALEKYLEVRRLSVVLGKNEAISLGNLGFAYFKLGKTGLADQYFQESLAQSKESSPVIYSILLPSYCEMLIETGQKNKARKLVLEAVGDSRYTQMSEYNLQYINLLSRLYPKYNYNLLFIIVGAILILVVIILIFKSGKRKKALQKTTEENNRLSHQIEEFRSVQDSAAGEEFPQENMLHLIGFFESFPRINELANKIKQKPDQKTEVLSAARELTELMTPFASESIEKELAYYIEHDNREFYDRLKNENPQLSLTDLRLCTLIRLGMNTKEIAVLTNKSVRGVESAKFRLRKKMNIDSSKDIYDYLLEMEKDGI